MVRLRDSDDRNITTAQLADIIDRVGCEQPAFRAVHDCLAAGGCNKARTNRLPSLLRVVLAENFGTKLPGPFVAALSI